MIALFKFFSPLLTPKPRRCVLVLPRKPNSGQEDSFVDFGGGWIAQRITSKSKRR